MYYTIKWVEVAPDDGMVKENVLQQLKLSGLLFVPSSCTAIMWKLKEKYVQVCSLVLMLFIVTNYLNWLQSVYTHEELRSLQTPLMCFRLFQSKFTFRPFFSWYWYLKSMYLFIYQFIYLFICLYLYSAMFICRHCKLHTKSFV